MKVSSDSSRSGLRSRRYGWYVLGLFASLNFFNYANRNIVLPMYDDLRAAFSLSNAELGLLTTAFMALHALVAIPAGWAADHFDRRRVIAYGIVVWSVGTLLVAAAVGATSLLAGRAVAGLGTGVLVPVANALLCDVFPDAQKARTISIFNVGLFVGGAAGFAIGALFGYPAGIILVALPPIAFAYLVARVDVPAQRASVADADRDPSWRAFWQSAVSILRIRSLRWLLLGAIMICFANGGFLAWFVDFVANTKGLSVEKATLVFGVSALTGGLAGVVAGGVVGDWLIKKVPYGRMVAVGIGLSCAGPFALMAIYVDEGLPFYVAAWMLMFFVTWYHGPLAAVVDDLVPDDRAATAQAGMIGLMHLFGTAPSAFVVGVVADETGLRTALLVPVAALVLAALSFLGGCRFVAADRAAAVGAQTTGTAG